MSDITRSNDDLLLELENIDTATTSIDGKVSTEAKQDAIIVAIDGIAAALPVAGDTGTETSVAASATSVSLLAANTTRKEVYIRNDSNKKMYIALGATATLNNSIMLKKDDIYQEDKYIGQISAIWEAAPTGNARITEVTKA